MSIYIEESAGNGIIHFLRIFFHLFKIRSSFMIKSSSLFQLINFFSKWKNTLYLFSRIKGTKTFFSRNIYFCKKYKDVFAKFSKFLFYIFEIMFVMFAVRMKERGLFLSFSLWRNLIQNNYDKAMLQTF